MLAPRFTLRTIFALTVAAAFVSMIGVWALQGSPWATGIALGLLTGVAMVTAQVIAFAGFWLCGEVLAGVFGWKSEPEPPEAP